MDAARDNIIFDEDMIKYIRDAEQSPLDVPELVIENDNPVWTIFMRYGAYIKVPNAGAYYENSKKITSMSRIDHHLQLSLPIGRHRLAWYNHEFEVEITMSESREIARIKLSGQEQCSAFRDFLRHAREYSNRKSCTESDVIVAKTFQGSSWSIVSSYPKRLPESLVIGDDTVKQLISDMKKFINSEEEYKKFGFPFKRNYLIVGPPGSGKSSLVTIAASELDLDICFMSIRAGMTETALCKAISSLGSNSMLVIEDAEVVCSNAMQGNHSAVSALAILTNILDGTLHKPKLITVLTSANPESLESVLVRHGRVDYTSRLESLTEKQVNLMVQHTFGDVEGLSKLANRLWKYIDRLGNISSGVLAHFLFHKRDLIPEQIDDDVCQQLSNGTHTTHINDAIKHNSGSCYM